MTRYIYFGDNAYEPNLNLAIDEVLLDSVDSGEVFVRFYSFSLPTIILAYRQSWDDLKHESIKEGNVSVARRLTIGGAMFCDTGSLCYSVIGGTKKPQEVYGTKIARVLSGETKSDVYIGKDFSLRTDNDTASIISGNGTKISSRNRLYHGIIAIKPWSLELLDRYIKLSEAERSIIPNLPYVGGKRSHLKGRVLEELTDGKYELVNPNVYKSVITKANKLAEEKYSRLHWIREAKPQEDGEGPKIETNDGFCFCITWGEPEKIIGTVKYSDSA